MNKGWVVFGFCCEFHRTFPHVQRSSQWKVSIDFICWHVVKRISCPSAAEYCMYQWSLCVDKWWWSHSMNHHWLSRIVNVASACSNDWPTNAISNITNNQFNSVPRGFFDVGTITCTSEFVKDIMYVWMVVVDIIVKFERETSATSLRWCFVFSHFSQK